LETLKYGRLLGIDRQKVHISFFDSGHEKTACHNQDLFGCQRNVFSGSNGGEGRLKTGAPRKTCHDKIGIRSRSDSLKARRRMADPKTARMIRQPSLQLQGQRFAFDRNHGRVKFSDLTFKEVQISSSGQGHNSKLVGMKPSYI
jgi:hypothetical protein